MSPAIFLVALASVSLNALAQISLRSAMIRVPPVPSALAPLPEFLLSLVTNLWFLAGMGCYAVSIGLWLAVLSKTEVSLAYPLLSVGYIITAVAGYFWLGEHVNGVRILGILFIGVGIFFISRSA